jgi:hypothetical protein
MRVCREEMGAGNGYYNESWVVWANPRRLVGKQKAKADQPLLCMSRGRCCWVARNLYCSSATLRDLIACACVWTFSLKFLQSRKYPTARRSLSPPVLAYVQHQQHSPETVNSLVFMHCKANSAARRTAADVSVSSILSQACQQVVGCSWVHGNHCCWVPWFCSEVVDTRPLIHKYV